MTTFLPSQGFFNFVIFIKPRYCAARRNFPDFSPWWALREAIWNPAPKHQRSNDVAKRRIPLNVNQLCSDVREPLEKVTDMSERVDDTETSCVDSTERCVNKSAVGIEDNQSSYLEGNPTFAASQRGSGEAHEVQGLNGGAVTTTTS
jgi:hypothetical protein